jgi:hypothetical protein
VRPFSPEKSTDEKLYDGPRDFCDNPGVTMMTTPNPVTLALLLFGVLSLSACSDNTEGNSDDESEQHVWQEKTDSIKEARKVADKLKRSAEATRKAAEN